MAAGALAPFAEGGSFFEAPRWRDGRWWASDFYRREIVTVGEDGRGLVSVVDVPGQPSGLDWLSDGTMVIASMLDHKILHWDRDQGIREIADLGPYCKGWLNDLVVDPSDRVYVGDFGFDLMTGADPASTSLKRVEQDGFASVAAKALFFPNGMVFTANGRTMLVAETFAGRITAFTVTPGGQLVDRRVWALLSERAPDPGPADEVLRAMRTAPDGCTLDAEGCVWTADVLGQRVIRVREGGEILDEVPAPDGLTVFGCMLGGSDGRTLLVTAAPDFFATSRAESRESVLLTTTVEVPHAGRP